MNIHTTPLGDVIHLYSVGFFLVWIWRPGFRTMKSRTCSQFPAARFPQECVTSQEQCPLPGVDEP